MALTIHLLLKKLIELHSLDYGVTQMSIFVGKKKKISCDKSFSYPVHSAKVDSFSEVETLVESTVVSSGEGDDKLACTLVGAIDLSSVRQERIRKF